MGSVNVSLGLDIPVFTVGGGHSRGRTRRVGHVKDASRPLLTLVYQFQCVGGQSRGQTAVSYAIIAYVKYESGRKYKDCLGIYMKTKRPLHCLLQSCVSISKPPRDDAKIRGFISNMVLSLVLVSYILPEKYPTKSKQFFFSFQADLPATYYSSVSLLLWPWTGRP